MEHQRRFIRQVSMDMDLPGEPPIRGPLIEIFGDCRVLIENHRGVKGYSTSEICVCTLCGTAYIQGQGLEIARMSKHQLVITGTIDGVRLSKEK